MSARFFKLVCVLLLCTMLGGCAIGVTKVRLDHDPLARVETKREGTILLKEFKDVRTQDRQYIGNKRNAFGMVLGNISTEEGIHLTEVLTGYFADSLKEAGYTVVRVKGSETPQDQGEFEAIVGGDIFDFWLDLYMAVWHYMGVKVTVKNPEGKILWENTVTAEQKNVLWVGATGEYERVISQSISQALNKAALEFVSEPFYRAIKSEKTRAVK